MAKIIKIGKLLGVAIPYDALEALGLKEGDEVEVRPRGGCLEIAPKNKRTGLRPEVQTALAHTLERHGEALSELDT